MKPVTCDYCGLPFKVRRVEPNQPVFCCAGCALASRVPRGGGEFPVTRELIVALVAGFGLFNQGLWWMMAYLMAGEGQPQSASSMTGASLVFGSLTWFLASWSNGRVGGQGVIDRAVALLTGGLILLGLMATSPACVAAGSLGALAWVTRGWFRKPKTKV